MTNKRIMTIHFCKLFRHFLKKEFRLNESDLVYYTLNELCYLIVNNLNFNDVKLSRMLFQTTKR